MHTVLGGRGEWSVLMFSTCFSFTLRASKITWIDDVWVVGWIERWLCDKAYSKMIIVHSMWWVCGYSLLNSFNIFASLKTFVIKHCHPWFLLSLTHPYSFHQYAPPILVSKSVMNQFRSFYFYSHQLSLRYQQLSPLVHSCSLLTSLFLLPFMLLHNLCFLPTSARGVFLK